MVCTDGVDTQSREHYAQVEAQVDTQVHMKNVCTEGPPVLMPIALSLTSKM